MVNGSTCPGFVLIKKTGTREVDGRYRLGSHSEQPRRKFCIGLRLGGGV